jgi:hypothetical protein
MAEHSLARQQSSTSQPTVAPAVTPLTAKPATRQNQALVSWLMARVQPKLTVNTPNDKYEREADTVADQVMRMSNPTIGQSNTPAIQRACTDCEEEIQRQPIEEEEEKVVQLKSQNGATPAVSPQTASQIQGLPGGGQPLPLATRAFFEPRFGRDFNKVRVHTGTRATQSTQAINARAYTYGNHIAFARGQFNPHSTDGQRLLAHELTHVVQQTGASQMAKSEDSPDVSRATPAQIQRTVSFDVKKWEGNSLGPPTPVNGADQRFITIPATGQIAVEAEVDVNGAAGDDCANHTVGTTQTAWIASAVMEYRGQRAADGSVTVRHRAQMPMRDPTPAGSIWYDPANLRQPAACGSTVNIRHFDSPWHSIPKARNNGAVAGSPLNYLTRYRRGLNLVTYLTTQDPAGTFRRQPLRFIYWNSLQDFTFTPQFPTAASNAPFLGMWPLSGGITVNIGSKNQGETSDAPYYTTAGSDFNTHYNNSSNWRITEQT